MELVHVKNDSGLYGRDTVANLMMGQLKEITRLRDEDPQAALEAAVKYSENAKQWLSGVNTVQETIDIDNLTEMLIDYLRRIHMNCEEAERLAHAVSIRCKRRIGEQLVEMKEDGLITKGHHRNDIDEHDIINRTVTKLADIGITPDQSSNYQAMAAIPEPVFDELVDAVVKGVEAPTKKAIVEKGREYQGKKVRQPGENTDKRIGVSFTDAEREFVKEQVKAMYPDVTVGEGLRQIILSFFEYES